jgi:peptidoglycan hydrolase-like protein with peptidoglycan-binding domain
MHDHELRAKRSVSKRQRSHELRLTAVVVAATVAALGGLAIAGAARERAAIAVRATAATPPAPAALAAVTGDALPDLEGVDVPIGDDCTIESDTLGPGDTGTDVKCLQHALLTAGLYAGTTSGTYDNATYLAVHQLQEDRGLFVDGLVGRETAMSVGVWPDEASLVVRTPEPPPGSVDLLGYPLSSVASAGADAPPVPPDSGHGKRVVYERAGQRVWAVDEDEQVVRSWLVSGSKFGNEVPGFHEVYSRSEMSSAWNFQAHLPLMIRYYETDIGHIGFHAIPLHVEDNSPYQTEAQLGTRLSGGCQRQANSDAAFLWDFAPVGTTVVVL